MMKLNYFFKKCQNGIESFNWIFVYFVYFFFSFRSFICEFASMSEKRLSSHHFASFIFFIYFFFEELFAKFEKFSSKQIQFLFSFLLLHF